jgi:hypothetical protein
MSSRVSSPQHVTVGDGSKGSVSRYARQNMQWLTSVLLTILSSRHDTMVSTLPSLRHSNSSGRQQVIDKATYHGGTRLTTAALEAQNADAATQHQFWEREEEKRVERLIKASRELGFELPRQCY